MDAASWIAEASGIPKLIIGATIVSVATTLPEMLVSMMAAAQGKADMSVGNAVGSVTANLGLYPRRFCRPAGIFQGQDNRPAPKYRLLCVSLIEGPRA